MRSKKRFRLTMNQFYAYKLSIRTLEDENFSRIFFAKKLFHQYIVDVYTKIEADNLNFIRHNQKELRSEHYRGLYDWVQSRSDGDCGKIVILPSSFSVTILILQKNFFYFFHIQEANGDRQAPILNFHFLSLYKIK